jgi:hypothetical protein
VVFVCGFDVADCGQKGGEKRQAGYDDYRGHDSSSSLYS